MIDLTKDELEILNTALSIYETRIYGNASPTRFSDFLRKLGKLVDSYCKSECDHEFKLSKCFHGIDENVYRCTKCLLTYDNLFSIE